MIRPEIRNLIFDLGGVLLDLHHDRCYAAFSVLSGWPVDRVKAEITGTACFIQHEKGLISDAEFRSELRKIMGKNPSDQQINDAWNAIIGDIPRERLEMLTRLRAKYRVFLLSNTNAIHVPLFGDIVRKNTGATSLESFFETAYYSHILQMRKPDTEIFDFVIRENNLIPEQTLFLDDYAVNLVGAEKTGLRTFQVHRPEAVLELFA